MAQLVVRRAAHKIRMINVKQRRWHNESVANKTHDTHEMNRANCDFRIDLTFIYVSMTQKPSKILRRVQKKIIRQRWWFVLVIMWFLQNSSILSTTHENMTTITIYPAHNCDYDVVCGTKIQLRMRFNWITYCQHWLKKTKKKQFFRFMYYFRIKTDIIGWMEQCCCC